MYQSISNNSGITLTFTDDSIIWESTISRRRFPYGSLVRVRIGPLGFELTPCEGNSLTFAFHRNNRPIMEQMLYFTQNAMRYAPPARPIDLTAEKVAEENAAQARMRQQLREIASANEHRMRCNVCGHIFCYTDEDVRQSRSHQNWARAHAVASMFGTRMDMYGQQSQMDRELSKVVNYDRCPICHSNNVAELKESAVLQQHQNVPASAASPIEEIKKYKELLDMGIITQAEFDMKKRQLLGI